MANVINRTTLDYRRSVNDPDFPDPPWLVVAPGSPSATVIATVPSIYWKIVGDEVQEMTAGEKATKDAQILDAVRQSSRDGARDTLGQNEPMGHADRAIVETFAKRCNYLVNRISELQDALIALQASGGNAGARLNALPTSYLATNTKARGAYLTEIDADLNAGLLDI